MGTNLVLMVGGLVTFIILSVFAPIVLDNFATSGANTNIGSFSGAKSFNDLFPMLFYIGGMFISFGAMGVGAVQTVRGRLGSG